MQAIQDPAVPGFAGKLQRIATYKDIRKSMTSPEFVMTGAPAPRRACQSPHDHFDSMPLILRGI